MAKYLLPQSLWLWGGGALLLAALLSGVLLKADARLRALLICLAASAGLLVSFGGYQLRSAPAEDCAGYSGEISGEVTTFPQTLSGGGASVELRLKTDGLPELKTLLFSYDYDISSLRPGDIIVTEGTLRSAATRAGKSDYRYNAEGIYLLGSASDEVKITKDGGPALRYLPARLARSVEQSAIKVFSADTAPLLTALLTGNKELLYGEEELYADMSAAGILHIVAVSGLHVAFLVGFIQSVVRRKKRLAAALAIALIWVFVPVAGATPSVVRAAFMQSTLLLAPIFRRENDAVTSLSAILAILLLLNPDCCASVSLQLSFAAMLGIILLTPKIYGRIDSALPKAPRRLISRALVSARRGAGASFAATIGALTFSAPIAALYFGSVSIIGILVNILIFWIVSLCFVLGYVACLLGLAWLPAGRLLGFCVSLPAKLIICVVSWAASVPYASIQTGSTAFGLWLVLVYAVFIICFVFKPKNTAFRPVIPSCLAICSLCVLICATELNASGESARLTALDVGQGQCLVATDGEATIVIDCGGKNGAGNAGELCAARLLGQGRRSIDLLALTHTDSDHINGVTRLMSRVSVKNLLLPADSGFDEKREKILRLAEKQGAKVYIISEDTSCTVGGLCLTACGPDDMEEPALIYLLSAGDRDVLITGDAYGSEERRFLKTYLLPPVEVYVAGHHGSKHSGSKELLAALPAKYAVISSGYNSYGHPAPETLERLHAADMEILRTDEKGDITLILE